MLISPWDIFPGFVVSCYSFWMVNLAPADYGGLLMVVGCTVDCCRLLALSCVYAVGLRALVNGDEPFQFKFPAHPWGIDWNQACQTYFGPSFLVEGPVT